MTPQQLEEIKEAVANSIKEVVNGKIDKLHSIMEQHMEDDKVVADKLMLHLAKEEEWKKKAEPIIEMGSNISGFGKITLYLIGFIMAFVGVISAFFAAMNKLKWG